MSFSADVEHIWAPAHTLAPTIQGVFAKGVCTVWADEQLTAAIPATNEEAEQLADLMDVAVISLEDGMPEYFELRDRLCGDLGYQRLTLLFIQEMDKLKKQDEADERATVMGCAAKRNIKPAEPIEKTQPRRITRHKWKYVLVDESGNSRLLKWWESVLYWFGKEDFSV